MKKFRLSYRVEARDDLDRLYDWIVENQGSTRIANEYIARLRSSIRKLSVFPQRGTRRDDLIPGLRIIGFERRAAIAFQMVEDRVFILRIFYGGRDLAALGDNATAPAIDDESGAITEN